MHDVEGKYTSGLMMREFAACDEDEERRVRARAGEVRIGDDVVGELDALRSGALARGP